MTGQLAVLHVAARDVMLGKTILKEAFHQAFVITQRSDIVAKVPWWQHAGLLAQPPAAAAVVGDSDNGSDIVGVFAQSAQQLRHTGSAADCHDARPIATLLAPHKRLQRRPIFWRLQAGPDFTHDQLMKPQRANAAEQ